MILDCRNTIVLTQEEFAALTNQGLTVAHNNLKNSQTSPPVLRVSNQSVQPCIKQEPGVRQDIQVMCCLSVMCVYNIEFVKYLFCTCAEYYHPWLFS